MSALIIAIILVLSPPAAAAQSADQAAPPPAVPPSAQASLFRQQSALRGLERRIERLQSRRDAMGDLNQQDMLQLQYLMEQKRRLEQMISDTMKAAGDSQNGAVGNLKAS